MVMGQLIFKARISNALWKRILDFAAEKANEGCTVLLDYLEEPVNCQANSVKDSEWYEIELGADSFRFPEWQSIHKVIAIVLDFAVHDIKSVQYYEWKGVKPNNFSMDIFIPEEDGKE